ncbi:MAG TPA: hypothetical protein VJR89_36750 [Polyangiales bacterium]|nr:hypothetical protein [Polyangiales bacterium]
MTISAKDLKELLSQELQATIGKLWDSEQDKAFLQYNAEKVAKYVAIYKAPDSTDPQREEAKFNLDMLQASVAAYAHQKTIVASRSAEETAKHVLKFVIGVLIKLA